MKLQLFANGSSFFKYIKHILKNHDTEIPRKVSIVENNYLLPLKRLFYILKLSDSFNR